MGKFVTAQPITPELGTAPTSAALEDALVWACCATAEEEGYHPTGGESSVDVYEHEGDWWVRVMINVAEDTPVSA